MIVADDANLDAAAEAALWGGMANAGQTCVGIERVYVTEKSYDGLLAKLTEKAQGGRGRASPTATSRCRARPTSSRTTSTTRSSAAVRRSRAALSTGPWSSRPS